MRYPAIHSFLFASVKALNLYSSYLAMQGELCLYLFIFIKKKCNHLELPLSEGTSNVSNLSSCKTVFGSNFKKYFKHF